MHAYLIEILLYIVPGYAEKKVPYSFDYNIKQKNDKKTLVIEEIVKILIQVKK